MPDVSSSKQILIPTYDQSWTNYWPPSGSKKYLGGLDVLYNIGSKITRTGGKAPKGALKSAKRLVGYTWSWKEITIPGGKRLLQKEWVARLNRFVWSRERIKVQRLVRQKSYSSRSKSTKGLNLPPNALNFYNCTSVRVGSNPTTLTGTHSSPGYAKVIEGPLHSVLNLPYMDPVGAAWCRDFTDGYGNVYPSFISGIVTKLDAQALASVCTKVKNQSFNLAQVYAERAQTKRLIIDAAKRIAKSLLLLKKGQLSKAGKILFPSSPKAMANDWLAYQFGVMPLLSDIDGIAQSLAEPTELLFDVKVVKREKYNIKQQVSYQNPKCISTGTAIGEVTVKYQYQYALTVDPEVRDMVQQGLYNPASLAWELIPYSFVVDWFLPIGNYLDNMDAFLGVRLVHAHKTVFVKDVCTYTNAFGGRSSDGYTWETKKSGTASKRCWCIRSVITTDPVMPLPKFKDPFSTTHVADVTALLMQLKK